MKKIALETIGCRLNQYDTECIAAGLIQFGFERVAPDERADLIIINTCTVTGRADATCRNIISRAARQQPPVPVVVIGCYVDSDAEKVAALYGVDMVVNNRDKKNIVSILKNQFPELFDNGFEPASTSLTEFYRHNRAWIKIGDGCNQNCSYCIIPSVRGELTNRRPDEIVDEINQLCERGYREIVLTGIHIGQYNWGDIKSPAQLVRFLLDNSDIGRLRLSSIEPQEVDEALVQVMIDGAKRVCRHLHIPLQSGSDSILKKMHRPYNRNRYLEIAKMVKEGLGSVTLGSDIIVGFPGESEDDFQMSVETARCGLLDYLHVFSYSDRPGTEATKLTDKVNPEVIKRRNNILRDISSELYATALKKEVGKTVGVISEHRAGNDNFYWGITDNYLKVALPEGLGGGREILNLEITDTTESYLIGLPTSSRG